MKRFFTISILFFTLAVISPSAVSSQEKPENPLLNRIKVSYGDALYVHLSEGIYGSLFLGVEDFSSTGAVSAGYRRLSRSQRWGIGADFTYMGTKQTLSNGYRFSTNSFTIIPTAEYYYRNKGFCRLYGSLGVGFSLSNNGFYSVPFQINPIAVRIGNKRVAAFAELGFGFKGLANLGLEVGF